MIIDKSEKLDQFFGALAAVQGQVKQPTKDQSGYNQRYKYAELSQYIELPKQLLLENGLSILQIPGEIGVVEISHNTGKEYINTKVPVQKVYITIGHTSGQYMTYCMEIMVEKGAGSSWGQSTGSAITYARRYSRGGALAMNAEDDDNQVIAAQMNNNKKTNVYPNKIEQTESKEVSGKKVYDISKYQIDDLKRLLADDIDLINHYKQEFNVDSLTKLNNEQYFKIKDDMRLNQLKKEVEDDKLLETYEALGY